MQPLTLKLTAFGPYKQTEIIDFNELEQHKLFVISGNTGAGKTTIFDGICFALYGSASGTDRDSTTMLRSDFADDETHTSAELSFELNGRVYRILRQLGHVKAGNKSKTGERYEFYEIVDGKETPCVDRQMVSEIDKKVEALLGLTQDQFKQIVMLPQGEFRKLLTSKTENKEEILRRLFKTEPYKQISERLKGKRDAVEDSCKSITQKRDNFIQNIPATLPERENSLLFDVLSEEHFNSNQIVAGLEEEVTYYKERIAIDQKKYDEAYQAHNKKQNEFHKSQALNEQFKDLDHKADRLEALNKQVPLFTNKEKQLEAAERAGNMAVYETQTEEWRTEEKRKQKALGDTKTAKKKADDMLVKVSDVYEQEKNKQETREEVSRKADRLSGFLPTVKDIDARKRELNQLEKEVGNAFNEQEKVISELKDKNSAMEKMDQKIKAMDEAVGRLRPKEQKLSNMREQAVTLESFLKVKEKQTVLDKDFYVKETAYKKIKTAYEELEKGWLNSQASMLATHLHDGEACPVCGSHEHPSKAINKEGITTKKELEALKKELDQKDSDYRTAQASCKTNATQLKEKTEAVSQYNIDLLSAEEVYEQLVKDGKQLREEVKQLEKTSDELVTLKKIYETAKQEIKRLETRKEKAGESYQKQQLDFAKRKTVFEERLREVPEEVRVLSELEKQIAETEKRKVSLEKAWEDAQQNLQQVKEEQTKATSNLSHAKQQLDETVVKREEAEKQFKQALADASFESESSFHEAKMEADERKKLKEEIDGFKQTLTTLKQQVKELKESLKDKSRADLTELGQQLEQLKQASELALQARNQSKEYYQEAAKLKENIMNANEQVKEQEKQLGIITDLYDVIRGQNSHKISFERYLQIEYLEQIIDTANQRLKHLSNGQFLLIRSDRQESHGRQSGLAFDVYDAYTGQTRDVKTLSGGEKFNTSLCLALGMSDVIQSFQGNISINTMFIDEGFGSLDEESLHKSIDTLIELQQSGRTIGVISHVQELKSIFPAVLEVTKTKEGNSRTEFVIK